MSQRNSIDLEIMKTLCKFDGIEFISKSGNDYMQSLDNIFSLYNNNDKPFTIEDIKHQPLLTDFKFSGVNDYKYGYVLCKCKLVDCIEMAEEYIEDMKNNHYIDYICGDYKIGRFAWILEDVEAISSFM